MANKALIKHTSQAFVLSLNIVTQANNEFTVSSIPIVRLTRLIFTVYTILQWATRQWVTVQRLPQVALNLCEQFYLLVNALQETMLKTMQETMLKTQEGGYYGCYN